MKCITLNKKVVSGDSSIVFFIFTFANILPRLFNGLLGAEDNAPIETDRAHRTLGPKSQDPKGLRDILCRIHYFTVKELIMWRARDRGEILLDGYKIQLLL